MVLREVDHLIILNTVLTLLLQALIRTLYRVLLQAQVHTHILSVIGAHTHSVAIGSHGHTITVNAAGNAENTVKNIAFNYIVRLA